MAVPYNAIVTRDDVEAEMRSSFPGYDASDANTITFMESTIREVTSVMEGLLGRNIIADKHEQYFQYENWDYDRARDRYFIRSNWPVVEIDTTGFTPGKSLNSRDNDIIVYTNRFSGLVTYYSGYKREDQTLSDFSSALPDLGTEPGNVPYDIRAVAIKGVLHRLAEQNQGPGQRSRTINPAVQSTTVTEPLRTFLMRIVKERIPHHMVIR